MKKQIQDLIKFVKTNLHVDGCITGSALLDYYPGQDVDIFCYSQEAFTEAVYFMYYNKMFQILEPGEQHKFNQFTKEGKSSLDSIGLITLKFKWNTCIDCNLVFKKYQKNIFSVLAAFDIDIITCGYDLKTKKTLNLRESVGKKGSWNKWNKSYYSEDQWSCKRLLRQWQRIYKYEQRGWDLSEVTNKYISMVEKQLQTTNIYNSEKGTKFHEDTQEQFKVVLKLLKAYKKEKKISPEGLLVLKQLI